MQCRWEQFVGNGEEWRATVRYILLSKSWTLQQSPWWAWALQLLVGAWEGTAVSGLLVSSLSRLNIGKLYQQMDVAITETFASSPATVLWGNRGILRKGGKTLCRGTEFSAHKLLLSVSIMRS